MSQFIAIHTLAGETPSANKVFLIRQVFPDAKGMLGQALLGCRLSR